MLRYSEIATQSNFVLNKIKDEILDLDINGYTMPTASTSNWEVVHNSFGSTTGMTTCVEVLIIKGRAKSSTYEKPFFIRFEHPGIDETGTTPQYESTLFITVGESYDDVNKTVKITHNDGTTPIPERTRFVWSAGSSIRKVADPAYLYLSITEQRIAMVISSDPTTETSTYRKSFCYIGAMGAFSGFESEEFINKSIVITAGNEYAEESIPGTLPTNTSRGNREIQVLKTKSGVNQQRHFPAFITQAMNSSDLSGSGIWGVDLLPQGFNASAWTKKYHLSPIYVVHPVDGYRGTLEYCIAVSKNNILHLDNLIVDIPAGTPGKTWTKEHYTYFDHNSEYNFMNRSANISMGIALLSKVEI